MEYERTWRVEESSLESSVWADIVNPFTLQLEQRVRNQYQLLDTFEGGIWKQGDMLLYNSISGHRGYELWKRADFLSGLPLTMAQEGRKKARFWWEFATQEGNPFQEQIKSACKLRALLEVHSFNLEKIRYAVKNEDLKSVAWLELITLRNRATDDVPESSRQFVRILPLRGYDHELKKLQKKIQQMGLPPCSDQWLEKYLVESGIEPSAYHAKPSIPIEADDPVRDMVLHYIRTLLDIARVNEAGIIEDIDIEFLHDYRVSLRKIRSILSLVRNIFSSEQTRWLKREFAAIAKRTNHLRDLDVYLLEQENYREMVPAALSDGVDELFTSLVAARKRELSRVRRWLRSTEYRNAIEKLQLSLAGEGEVLGVGDKAEQAVITVARREFSKKFHKVGKLGSRIDASTPDEEVHDLRIECKKLRYLLEFFGGLFSRKMQRGAVSTLKKLQDNLGRFNDLSVQQESLEAQLKAPDQKQPPLLAAVGGLIGALNHEQRMERARVTETFRQFYSAQTRELYAAMVSEGESEKTTVQSERSESRVKGDYNPGDSKEKRVKK